MRTLHDVTRHLPCTNKSHCHVVVGRLKFAALGRLCVTYPTHATFTLKRSCVISSGGRIGLAPRVLRLLTGGLPMNVRRLSPQWRIATDIGSMAMPDRVRLPVRKQSHRWAVDGTCERNYRLNSVRFTAYTLSQCMNRVFAPRDQPHVLRGPQLAHVLPAACHALASRPVIGDVTATRSWSPRHAECQVCAAGRVLTSA